MNDAGIVTDDDQTYLINVVNLLNKSISQYGLGLIWFVGNIGLVFVCIVFSQPVFHKSPCAMFFFASSFSQFFTFNFALFTRMVQFGYDIQTVNTVLWFCKIRYYLFYIFVSIPRYNIILASIDRYLASSCDALRRQWSSPKIAIRLIIVNIIFWCLIYIQVIIFYEINNGSCLPKAGTYATFFSIYISIDSGILPIFLMLIFGSLMVRNVHQTRKRVGATTLINKSQPVRVGGMSRKDVQLHKMLANQICLFVTLNLPNPCYLVYRSFTINTRKSPLRVSTELFINNMTYVLIYLGFALTFVNFIVASDMLRREFQQVIQTKILRRPPMIVISPAGTRPKFVRKNEQNKDKL